MKDRLRELALRREALVARAAAQRASLAAQCAVLLPSGRAIDRVQPALEMLRRHPLLLAGVAAGVAAWRPRGLARWFGRALFAWRGWLAVRAWLRDSAAR